MLIQRSVEVNVQKVQVDILLAKIEGYFQNGLSCARIS